MDLNIKPFLKYKRAIMIILVYYLFFLSLTIFFNSSETYANPTPTNLTPLIPINNLYIEVALIFLVLAPTSALIGGLMGGYILTPVFIFIHKKILGSNLLYGIQERPQPQTFKKISRGYYPALFSVNLNSIVLFSVPWILEFLLNKELVELGGLTYSTLYVPGFLVLVMFTIGFGALVFSPIWFLTDAGIVYSNQVRVSGTDEPV
jgi:hypothetical protein